MSFIIQFNSIILRKILTFLIGYKWKQYFNTRLISVHNLFLNRFDYSIFKMKMFKHNEQIERLLSSFHLIKLSSNKASAKPPKNKLAYNFIQK